MVARRSDVFLSDFMEAVHLLRPDEEELRIIADLMGLRRFFGGPDNLASGRQTDGRSLSEVESQGSGRKAETPPPTAPKTRRGARLTSTLERAPSEVMELTLVEEPMAAPSLEGLIPARLLDPLFLPLWTRAILGSSLATHVEEGMIDVDRIVGTLAQWRPLLRIPRLLRPTLRKGVQMLVDRGQAMVPFTADEDTLSEEVRNVVGVERVQCLIFAGCPTRGIISDPLGGQTPYVPPPPDTPVVVLTDLGIGRPPFPAERGTQREWLEFAASVARARCPLIAFVPYSPNRWPRALRRVMTIVQWDRGTSAGMVYDRIRRGDTFQ